MHRYVKVTEHGVIEPLDTTSDGSYRTISGAVGGLIECVPLGEHMTMWLNEEGKVNGLAHNPWAQALFDHVYGSAQDYIVGPAVFTGGNDDDGDTLGLPVAMLDMLADTLQAVTDFVTPHVRVTTGDADGEVVYDSRGVKPAGSLRRRLRAGLDNE